MYHCSSCRVSKPVALYCTFILRTSLMTRPFLKQGLPAASSLTGLMDCAGVQAPGNDWVVQSAPANETDRRRNGGVGADECVIRCRRVDRVG